MMRIVFLSFLLLGVALGNAIGACQGPRIGDQPNELERFIANNRLACGTATSGNDKWQEEHRADGVLFERAKGPNDPIDPSHQVGTWAIENRVPADNSPADDFICYSYSGGSRYCFRLYGQSNTPESISFCDAAGNEVATVAFRNLNNTCGF